LIGMVWSLRACQSLRTVQLIDDHSGNAPEARTVVKNPIGSECIPADS
jgi:hypothetical protein